MKPLRTQPRKVVSSRSDVSKSSSVGWPEKPRPYHLSSSRLNSLLVLAMGMMIAGLFLGWGITTLSRFIYREGSRSTVRSSRPILAHAREQSMQRSQHQSMLFDIETSSAVIPSPSPAGSSLLLQGQAVNGWRLYIPALNVDTPIKTIHPGENGRLQMPLLLQWDGAAWNQSDPYTGLWGSPFLGDNGPRLSMSPAAFDKLSQLRSHEQVGITDQHGSVTYFSVVDVRTYTPEQIAISGDASGASLDLVANVHYGTSSFLLVAVCDRIAP